MIGIPERKAQQPSAQPHRGFFKDINSVPSPTTLTLELSGFEITWYSIYWDNETVIFRYTARSPQCLSSPWKVSICVEGNRDDQIWSLKVLCEKFQFWWWGVGGEESRGWGFEWRRSNLKPNKIWVPRPMNILGWNEEFWPLFCPTCQWFAPKIVPQRRLINNGLLLPSPDLRLFEILLF